MAHFGGGLPGNFGAKNCEQLIVHVLVEGVKGNGRGTEIALNTDLGLCRFLRFKNAVRIQRGERPLRWQPDARIPGRDEFLGAWSERPTTDRSSQAKMIAWGQRRLHA